MKGWLLALFAIHILIECPHPGDAQDFSDDIGNGADNDVSENMDGSWSKTHSLARSTLFDRQERLQQRCDQMARNKPLLSVDDPKKFRNILVDDKHKLLYCYVPKVACTNWKRVLMMATGKWKGNGSPLEIPANLAHASGTFVRLSNLSTADIEDKLASYDKLIVVRHPFERLLSAYRNKFEARYQSSAYFQTRFGRKIIKRYRLNATEESLVKGDDVTFGEFVDFIVEDNDNSRNEHWQSIAELCHPCLVNYNLISRYETLVEDATEILDRIDANAIAFPVRPQNSEPTSKMLDKYYSRLTLGQLRDLAELYRDDFYLFEYSLEQVLGFSVA